MTTQAKATVARADVVGSLLRPSYLREARQGCEMAGLPYALARSTL